MRFNGDSWRLWETNPAVKPSRKLHWYSGETQNRSGDLYDRYPLSAGTNTVEIACYSSPLHVDWLLIKDDTVSATPVGKGKEHTP